MSESLIKLEGIKKIFYTEEVETHSLSNITFTINKGEYVSISGPSGCGKSTLLSILGLLDTTTEGKYTLAGHDVSNISKSERAKIRNKEIGFVFQSFNLISDLDVEENVELPLTYRTDLSKDQRKQMVKDALEKVDMAHRAKHFPSQLSGGQQQRVAVARAIAGKPSIILADEPTGNLDTKNAEAVMQLLDKLNAEGATICMVTHDPRSALRTGRKIDIVDGRIVADKKNSDRKIEMAVRKPEEELA
jgi:putative ABC transport system ATP-binding protein